MARFLHTSDWQLGMTRHFLSDEAQARFSQDRLDAIRTLGEVAAREKCEFVVVAGDVFESNHVDRRTVSRAIEALRTVPVPVYLLPGNHDPLDAGSVLRSPAFQASKPDHVHVLEDMQPVEAVAGVEVVGAPWTSKRPLSDLVADACGGLSPELSTIRVLVAHGRVDVLVPRESTNPSLIDVAAASRAVDEGRIHYLALGDRHSVTRIGDGDAIWYSGAPEPTAYDEVKPGHVLVVDVDHERVVVTPHEVGRWKFAAERFDMNGDDDVAAMKRRLDELPDKERTVVKIALVGTLTLRHHARLEETLESLRDVFGAVQECKVETDLAIVAEDADFEELDLAGFARSAVEDLRAAAGGSGPGAVTARNALGLLVRLAGRNG